MKPLKTIVSWSSGKDSTLTLIKLLADPRYEVVGLYTTYLKDEVPFQATPLDVVKEQARLAGLSLITIPLPEVFPPNEVYQSLVVNGLRGSKVVFDAVAFGDMFCNGIADYRRSYIEPAGWQCVFPLLGGDSRVLAKEIIDCGIRTLVTTVDTSQLDGRYCGHWYTEDFLVGLPEGIDPCGEDGEFHTLVIEAPCFSGKLQLKLQGIERQDRFHYQRYQLMNSTFAG
ncbi:Putative ATPases of PP-loop superfamily [Photobacterium marinum]|uniref:Putative ATPases of PP-loop superfamily n=1 Tax=Photobacterium marinum TaxID=1056511 RepID=L8J539_9GAMM|nr:ATPase of PP-loop superfamily [Photobacterium marinum]ELR63293.1 Putative ATPases of PP-loop superfamily [Photobacterium marinum]